MKNTAAASWLAISATVVAGLSGCALGSSTPSDAEMGQEVAALQAQVLPVVQDLKATWYFNALQGC